MRWLLMIALVGCGTASQNTKAAAVATVAAAAVTTALDPDYASRAEEDNRVESLDGKPVAKIVPASAFDELDEIPVE